MHLLRQKNWPITKYVETREQIKQIIMKYFRDLNVNIFRFSSKEIKSAFNFLSRRWLLFFTLCKCDWLRYHQKQRKAVTACKFYFLIQNNDNQKCRSWNIFFIAGRMLNEVKSVWVVFILFWYFEVIKTKICNDPQAHFDWYQLSIYKINCYRENIGQCLNAYIMIFNC